MSYIYPAPGVTGVQATLAITASGSNHGYTTNAAMNVPAMQDITVNAAIDIFTWTQLDAASKKNIPTTANNSLSGNVVVDEDTFFGDGTTDGVQDVGLFGLSTGKTKVDFDLYLGDNDDGSAGKTVSGSGYIVSLAPTVSADSPVWVTPFTLTVDGDYSVA